MNICVNISKEILKEMLIITKYFFIERACLCQTGISTEILNGTLEIIFDFFLPILINWREKWRAAGLLVSTDTRELASVAGARREREQVAREIAGTRD